MKLRQKRWLALIHFTLYTIFMSIEIRASHLRVMSAILSNAASGLLLLPLTVKDIMVLTVSLSFAIVSIVMAVKIEDILEEL